MKKILSALLCIILLMSCLFVSTFTVSAAVTGICGDNLTWSYDTSNGVLTINGTGDMYDYELGKGYAGTDTSDSPWNGQYRKEIKKIIVSEGVTSIGNCAFYHCTALEEIVLPDGLVSIGNKAISRCDVLKEIDIPSTVTTLDESFISQCPLISSVVIPNGVTAIPDRAFESCSNLSIISIPDTVTSIGNYAFSNCSSLEAITLPTDLTTMGTHVFYASGIKELTIPDGVTAINACTFYNCTSLEKLVLGNNIATIGNYAFYNASNLTIYAPLNSYAHQYAESNGINFSAVKSPEDDYTYSVSNGEATITKYNGDGGDVVIPETLGGYPVTGVGEAAFRAHPGLTSITIANNVTSIGRLAFWECTELTSVFIGDSVDFINGSAFYGCSALTELVVSESNPSYTSYDDVVFNKDKTTIVACIGGKSGSYIIPDGVKVIGDFAFYGCSKLKSITIPDGVTSIGERSFSKCYELTSVTVPDSTISLGFEAFYDCSSLTEVILGNSVTSIGGNAFDNCKELKTITIPDSVKNIGSYAFYGCTNLTIFAPSGSYAHQYAVNNGIAFIAIKSPGDDYDYTVLNGALTIDGYVGDGGDVIIPSTIDGYTVTGIAADAFKNCTTITSLIIPDSVTSIGAGAFSGCSGLESITIPFIGEESSATYRYPLGYIFGRTRYTGGTATKQYYNYAEYAITLYTYYIPTSLKYVNVTGGDIPSYAFYNCAGLINIILPEDTKSIGSNAFFNCSGITNIAIPSSVTSIGFSAFNGCSGLANIMIPDSVTNIGNSAFSGCNDLTIYGYPNSYAQEYATSNNINFAEIVDATIKSASYEYSDGKIVFTVITKAGTFNRMKLTTSDNLTGAVITANSYTVNSNGDYVWTIKYYAPTETTEYSFDLRNSETGKYLKEYYTLNVEVIPTFKSISHQVTDGKIIFTVVTKAGDFSRIKVTTADNLKGSLGVASTYTINADGDYVWTVKATAPEETTQYAFDLRNAETGKYLKEYFEYEAEIKPIVKSVSHKVMDGKIIFTVVTSPDAYSRMKVTTADDLKGSLGVSSSYKVNENGDYVWTIKATAPSETTVFAFDLRSSETGKYIKNYSYYECVIENIIKSVTCEETGDKLVFTVITKAGDYSRLRCGTSESVSDNLANSYSYTVNTDGNYVWTLKVTAPTVDTDFYFDLRDATTNKYLKEFFVFNYNR